MTSYYALTCIPQLKTAAKAGLKNLFRRNLESMLSPKKESRALDLRGVMIQKSFNFRKIFF